MESKPLTAQEIISAELLRVKERKAISDKIRQIIHENCTFVDGQIRGLIIHGAIEKLTDMVIEASSGTEVTIKQTA